MIETLAESKRPTKMAGYYRAFETLYGVPSRDVSFLSKHREMIHVINVRASAHLDTNFSEEEVGKMCGIACEALRHFNDIKDDFLEEELGEGGKLSSVIAKLNKLYAVKSLD